MSALYRTARRECFIPRLPTTAAQQFCDAESAHRRFGVSAAGNYGECYSRTGRRFCNEPVHADFLDRCRSALNACHFWDTYNTDWAAIDCEIMPWNAKAQGLLREQYAPVGAAGKAALSAVRRGIDQTRARGIVIETEDLEAREDAISRFIDAYREYCWQVDGLTGLSVAPFHLLATEGAVHADKDHLWHLAALAKLADADPFLFRATEHITVDLADESSVEAAIGWWTRKTDAAAEGMVVKSRSFLCNGPKGIVQPAVKCRGREYLRIIYGPEYLLPPNLEGLRRRSLGRKRSLAQREFALGIEGLDRFVSGEPLHRYHECAFAVLALESEPVDPRL